MKKKISVEEIGYYGKRVTVFEPPLKEKNKHWRVVSHYRINGLQAEKIQTYLEGKFPRTRVIETVMLRDIYPRIKHVYDFDNVLIARRIDVNSPLRITGKGMSKFLQIG